MKIIWNQDNQCIYSINLNKLQATGNIIVGLNCGLPTHWAPHHDCNSVMLGLGRYKHRLELLRTRVNWLGEMVTKCAGMCRVASLSRTGDKHKNARDKDKSWGGPLRDLVWAQARLSLGLRSEGVGNQKLSQIVVDKKMGVVPTYRWMPKLSS